MWFCISLPFFCHLVLLFFLGGHFFLIFLSFSRPARMARPGAHLENPKIVILPGPKSFVSHLRVIFLYFFAVLSTRRTCLDLEPTWEIQKRDFASTGIIFCHFPAFLAFFAHFLHLLRMFSSFFRFFCIAFAFFLHVPNFGIYFAFTLHLLCIFCIQAFFKHIRISRAFPKPK